MKKKNKMTRTRYALAIIGIMTISILLATAVKAVSNNTYGSMHQGMMNDNMHSMMHGDMNAMHEQCEGMMGGEMPAQCEQMMQSGQCPMMNH